MKTNTAIHLIVNPSVSNHVSEDAVSEFEHAILTWSQIKIGISQGDIVFPRLFGAMTWRLYEAATSMSVPLTIRLSCPLKGEYIAILMGRRFRKCLPYFVFARRKFLYMFDAWPQYHDQIKEFTNLFKIDFLFVSSRQAAESLRNKCDCPVFWVPEGVDSSAYRYCDYGDKDIDVLEFGRRYELYHNAINDCLVQTGKMHLYEKKGKLVFETRAGFIDGLARSRISICFPSNITDPERTGGFETMTTRYLQSMASKCLIIGKAPMEMIDLFGYNPVVEMDMSDPCGQLFDILENYEGFIPIVERNYREILQNHTWDKRWEKIASAIF